MNYEAIYRAYPNVISIHDDTGAFDINGNPVTLDQAVVADAAIEVANEKTLETLRIKRNRLLTETDYLALSDTTLTDDMKTYRQELRDLPQNTDEPANPVWPIKPV